MRALVFVGKRRLEWHEHSDLRVEGALEAIVRPIASTTCDLDRRILAGLTPFEPPFPLGHEAVAEVIEIGTGVLTISVGDLVVVPWHISCGVCAPCRRGLTAHCEAVPGLSGYGVSVAGAFGGLFSEQVRVPFADGMLTPLPDGVDPIAVASASDNLTDAYIGVAKGMARHPGAPVLVVSSVDSLGLFAVDHALAAGASSVDYVDIREDRLELARSLGARIHATVPESFTRRFPVVIGATREASDLKAAMLCLSPGGHFSNVAILFGDTPLPLWDLYLRDATYSSGLPSVKPQVPRVLELARCGHIHPERIMTPLEWDSAPRALLEPHLKPVMVRPRLTGRHA